MVGEELSDLFVASRDRTLQLVAFLQRQTSAAELRRSESGDEVGVLEKLHLGVGCNVVFVSLRDVLSEQRGDSLALLWRVVGGRWAGDGETVQVERLERGGWSR